MVLNFRKSRSKRYHFLEKIIDVSPSIVLRSRKRLSFISLLRRREPRYFLHLCLLLKKSCNLIYMFDLWQNAQVRDDTRCITWFGKTLQDLTRNSARSRQTTSSLVSVLLTPTSTLKGASSRIGRRIISLLSTAVRSLPEQGFARVLIRSHGLSIRNWTLNHVQNPKACEEQGARPAPNVK
jgi:hypothetical protein